MRARNGDKTVALAGTTTDDAMADMRDDRSGVAGLFFAAFLGSGDTADVEVIE